MLEVDNCSTVTKKLQFLYRFLCNSYIQCHVNSRSVIIVSLNYNFDYFFVISLFHTLQRKFFKKKQKQKPIKTIEYIIIKNNEIQKKYLHNLCKLVIFFITIKTGIWLITSFESIFTEKPWRNPVISHDFRWKSQFFPKIRQKFAYSNFLLIIKKRNGPNFVFLNFLFYLTCFTTVPIFESIGPLVAEIWWGGGGGQISPPPNGLKSSK